jgi:hypothetical protein
VAAPLLRDAHAELDRHNEEKLREVDREVEVISLSEASARDLSSSAMRDTWPGPGMRNPTTGRLYPERELWQTAELIVDAAICYVA